MAKVYITFGQPQTHTINGKTLDKDCIAVIKCKDHEEGRALAFEWFDGVFHNCYEETYFNSKKEEILQFFPRGLIEVN